MPLRDRLWWLQVIGALACAAAAIGFPYAYLAAQLPLDQELQLSPITDFLLAAALMLLFLIIAIVLVVSAERGQRRLALRRRALAGDTDAIPLAALVVHPENAPNILAGPLILSWRATKQTRFVMGLLYLLIFAAQLGGIAIYGGAFVYFAIVAWAQDGSPSLPTIAILVAGVLIVTLFLLLVVVVVQLIPTMFGRPYGVTASIEGIVARNEFGRTRLMRWEEMRLFEVDGSRMSAGPVASRGYRVYGAGNNAIAWRDNPLKYSEFAPDGISPGDMAVRLQALFDLINARTGLAPRAFARGLRAKQPAVKKAAAARPKAPTMGTMAPADSTRGSAWGAFALLVGFALATLGLAVVVVLLPVGLFPLFAPLSAASLVGIALLVAGGALWLLRQWLARAANDDDAMAPPKASAPISASGTYALRYEVASPWVRLGLGALGALSLVNLLPFLVVGSAQFWRIWNPTPTYDPGADPLVAFLAYILILYGAAGLFLLALARRLGTATIQTDAAGLTVRNGKKTTVLAWSRVEKLTPNRRHGAIVGYTVVGETGRTTLAWSAVPERLRPLPTTSAATPITPEQLAALVMERSALMTTVRGEG